MQGTLYGVPNTRKESKDGTHSGGYISHDGGCVFCMPFGAQSGGGGGSAQAGSARWAAIAILSLLMAVISPDKDKSAERDERSYDLDHFGRRW